MAVYAPIVLFFLAILLVTFATSPDRLVQVHNQRAFFVRITYFRSKDIGTYLTVPTILRWLVTIYLLTFLTLYLVRQRDVRNMLAERELELDVGTLKIPALAILKSEFVADTGFSRRKRRQRVALGVAGNVFSGFEVRIEETDLAKLAKLTGKAFEFNFLSDVKLLRPAIEAYMQTTTRNKVTSYFEIETFDNRGPYLLVVLDKGRRSGDLLEVANKIAAGLYPTLPR